MQLLDIIHNKTDFLFKYNPQAIAQPDDWLFICDKTEIHCVDNHPTTIANVFGSNINSDSITNNVLCFGTIHQRQCFCLKQPLPTACATSYNKVTLKTSYSYFSNAEFQAALLANHLSHWLLGHRYCGTCGAHTQTCNNELALQCTQCSTIIYPTIAPVVMGLIYRDDEILLAKHCYSTQNIYACLAGFVSLGETLEEALMREVNEEVALQIENIQYVASQPWPFPNSLMIGFTAKYLSGDIKIDRTELEDAAWYNIHALDKLPLLPSKISLSRYLIDRVIYNGTNDPLFSPQKHII